jgi:predicted DNA-binding protein (MmcQ/YjbR family)
MAKKKSAKKRAKKLVRGGGGRGGGSLRDFCRSLPHTTEDVKWGDDLVFSVEGKMYAAFDLDDEHELGFKCDDEDFERLTRLEGIIPAPYAARFGWVKVLGRRVLPAAELRGLLRKAHGLVFAGLPRGVRRRLSGEG